MCLANALLRYYFSYLTIILELQRKLRELIAAFYIFLQITRCLFYAPGTGQGQPFRLIIFFTGHILRTFSRLLVRLGEPVAFMATRRVRGHGRKRAGEEGDRRRTGRVKAVGRKKKKEKRKPGGGVRGSSATLRKVQHREGEGEKGREQQRN